MVAGHTALALLAKRARPSVPLVVLLAAAYGCDVLEITFDVLHRTNRELSHSLVSVVIVASVAAIAYWLARRDGAGALAVWLTYASHWPADFITGVKPTWPGGPDVGLYLYSKPM